MKTTLLCSSLLICLTISSISFGPATARADTIHDHRTVWRDTAWTAASNDRVGWIAVTALLALAGGDSVCALPHPFVRVRDELLRPGPAAATIWEPVDVPNVSAGVCKTVAIAWHNQPGPEGGTLAPWAFMSPAAMNDAGQIAFMAEITGPLRNQGVFVADEAGLEAIAIGCGEGGGIGNPGTGCGDPTPIGGTFSGFFGGTVFVPSLNDSGDVLFLCDVDGGSAPRALFLYQAASQSIVKIAAVGDSCPIGGTFLAVGPGTLNNSGEVVFLAMKDTTLRADIFRWQGGVVTKHAARGDPAPDGGWFDKLGTEFFGLVDGTTIPAGPVPGLNDQGQVSFRAILGPPLATRGILVTTGSVHQWHVRAGDPTPDGGTYIGFSAPTINEAAEVAFLADFRPTPTTLSSGWFAGSPGHWRKVIKFSDPVAGGQVRGLAVSRNPMRPLDDRGNLLVWTAVKLPDLTWQEHLVMGRPDGSLQIVATEGDPTPLGGQLRVFNPWPSLNRFGQGTLSAATSGAPGGVLNAHLLLQRCVWATTAPALEPANPAVATLRVAPNPFNPRTRILFTLPRRTRFDLSVYDLRGSRVRRLTGGMGETGSHWVSWDGKDHAERHVASGVYLVRLATSAETATARVVLVR